LQTGGGPTGDRGKPTDPDLLDEDALTKKEIDQGPAYFQLQHMLDTRLADAERYPLKLRNLVVMDLDKAKGPVGFTPGQRRPENEVKPLTYAAITNESLYAPELAPDHYEEWEAKAMYIDPAGGGQNGDETVAVVVYFLAGRIFVMEMRAFPGGVRDDVYEELTKMCYEWDLKDIQIEQNYGNGAFAQGWRSFVLNVWNKKDLQQYVNGSYTLPVIQDIWETGQKEIRIADTLEPVMARRELIIDRGVLLYDANSTQRYAAEQRNVYQLLWQIARLTRDKGALRHDDRVDALAGAVRIFVDRMAVDQERRLKDKTREENMQMFTTWENMGFNLNNTGPKKKGTKHRFKNAIKHRRTN
jgi:hypothetical protein